MHHQVYAQPRFRVAELPERDAIFTTLAERTNFRSACESVSPARSVEGLLSCRLSDPLLASLRSAAAEAIGAYGLHGWLSASGRRATDPYVALSLSYNPDLDEPGVTDIHQSALGTAANAPDAQTYGASERYAKLKHTYFDTYGFRLLTPAGRTGALGQFLSQCRLSCVRSRLALIRGSRDADSFRCGWHRDEPVFENLRINIPLRSHPSFRLQIERSLPEPREGSATLSDHYLEPGQAYTFDTHRPHRVYSRGPSDVDRVHLVLGFAPWFRYDVEADAWEPNEFYGRVHPFDILRSGALHPALHD